MTKIFIGGSKTIYKIDDIVKGKLREIIKNQYDVLIGDCFGVDKAVQEFFYNDGYRSVTVYVSGKDVRNNVGDFKVCNIPADMTGFEFYRQKDIAMENEADCGFMIWDGKSKGTLNNIADLLSQNKTCEVYFDKDKTITVLTSVNSKEFADLLRKTEIYKTATKFYDVYRDIMENLID